MCRGSEGAILRSGLPGRRLEKEERYYTTRGVVDNIGKVCLDENNNNGEDGNNKEESMWPKLFITLSSKEKEEDFMAMKGCKPSHRPKKRAKLIQRSLLVSFQYLFFFVVSEWVLKILHLSVYSFENNVLVGHIYSW